MNLQQIAIELARLLRGGTRIWPQLPPDLALFGDKEVYDPVDKQSKAGKFNEKLRTITRQDRFKRLDVAVIDFSGVKPLVALSFDPHQGPNGPNKPGSTLVASLAKVAMLYAAVQLREDVRNVVLEWNKQSAGTSGPTEKLTAESLKRKLQQFWKANSTRLQGTAADQSAVGLTRIFDLSELDNHPPNPAKIDFDGIVGCALDEVQPVLAAGSKKANLLDRLDELRLNEVATSSEPQKIVQTWQLKFAERLWMALGWSSNHAASACICDIGLPYIQALLYESDLFNENDGGLYLTRNYRDPPSALSGTFRRTNGAFPPMGSPSQIGTARSLAAFMIALRQNRLISEAASMEMKRLLRPLRFVRVDGHWRNLSGIGNTRITDALGCPDDDPLHCTLVDSDRSYPLPNDAQIKGGVVAQRIVVEAVTPDGKPVTPKVFKADSAYAIACDWEYLEFGNGRKMGMVVLNSEKQKPESGEAATKDAAEKLIKWEDVKQMEHEAEAQLRSFVREARVAFTQIFPP